MMKKFTGFFMLMLCVAVAHGQIAEEAKSMTEGNQNGFSIALPQTNKKEVEKSWEKFIKKYKGKTNKIKKTEEYLSNDARLESMSDNTVDIYSRVTQEGDDTQLTVWYDLGGAYLSSASHPEKVTVAHSMLDAFALSVSKAMVEDTLKGEEKTLKKLNGDFKGLEKDKSKLEDDIKKFEKKIEEAKAAIVKNEEDQKAKQTEIEAQEEVVEKVKKQLKEMN